MIEKIKHVNNEMVCITFNDIYFAKVDKTACSFKRKCGKSCNCFWKTQISKANPQNIFIHSSEVFKIKNLRFGS